MAESWLVILLGTAGLLLIVGIFYGIKTWIAKRKAGYGYTMGKNPVKSGFIVALLVIIGLILFLGDKIFKDVAFFQSDAVKLIGIGLAVIAVFIFFFKWGGAKFGGKKFVVPVLVLTIATWTLFILAQIFKEDITGLAFMGETEFLIIPIILTVITVALIIFGGTKAIGKKISTSEKALEKKEEKIEREVEVKKIVSKQLASEELGIIAALEGLFESESKMLESLINHINTVTLASWGTKADEICLMEFTYIFNKVNEFRKSFLKAKDLEKKLGTSKLFR